MSLVEALILGEFLERPNRFSVWVCVGRRRELAHLPNPGRLSQILVPGRPLLLRPAPDPHRKTRYTAIGAHLSGMLVSLDSTLPNRFFPQALSQGLIPPLSGWELVRKEPRLEAGRADFLLRRGKEEMLVEVKSVTWVVEGVALFPDAPTPRGRRHLAELTQAVQEGRKAAVVFTVQRPDAHSFGPSSIDPAFCEALRTALSAGVETFALVCSFDGARLHLERFLDPGSLAFPQGFALVGKESGVRRKSVPASRAQSGGASGASRARSSSPLLTLK